MKIHKIFEKIRESSHICFILMNLIQIPCAEVDEQGGTDYSKKKFINEILRNRDMKS